MASQRRDRRWGCHLIVNMSKRSGMTYGLCTSKRERCVCVGVADQPVLRAGVGASVGECADRSFPPVRECGHGHSHGHKLG